MHLEGESGNAVRFRGEVGQVQVAVLAEPYSFYLEDADEVISDYKKFIDLVEPFLNDKFRHSMITMQALDV